MDMRPRGSMVMKGIGGYSAMSNISSSCWDSNRPGIWEMDFYQSMNKLENHKLFDGAPRLALDFVRSLIASLIATPAVRTTRCRKREETTTPNATTAHGQPQRSPL
eukprot:6188421-Pleurochrysis_carterae.AAC.1